MNKLLQRLLLAIGILAFIALLAEIALSVEATMHGNTPTRVVHVVAGPYHLKVSLYTYPANAGFALPFAIAPEQSVQGTLTYNVTSIPDEGVHATPVHASISPDANVSNGVQGSAEITVQGQWGLDILVNGPAGSGEVDIPLTATAPPAIPDWLGWLIGLIPLYGLLIFLLLQRGKKTRQAQIIVAQ